MMLVNVMVPVLEHGLRPDWKSILPPATVTTASAQWLQHMALKARSGRPTAFDMLQVCDPCGRIFAPEERLAAAHCTSAPAPLPL